MVALTCLEVLFYLKSCFVILFKMETQSETTLMGNSQVLRCCLWISVIFNMLDTYRRRYTKKHEFKVFLETRRRDQRWSWGLLIPWEAWAEEIIFSFNILMESLECKVILSSERGLGQLMIRCNVKPEAHIWFLPQSQMSLPINALIFKAGGWVNAFSFVLILFCSPGLIH